MFSSEFTDYITQTISIGNRMFANDARRFLYSGNKEYYQLLNFDDDDVFLESFILSYFLNKKKDITLAQTFFKHLPTQSEKEILTDDKGIAYISGVGYFLTDFSNTKLIIKTTEGTYSLYQEGNSIDFKFTPAYMIPGSPIEIALHKLPYTNELFNEINSKNPHIEVENITQQHLVKVTEAFHLLKTHFPIYYEWLLLSIKKIQIFQNPDVWSFAAVRLYGISYLSAHERRSILFFLEDIVHQCAHNIFFAVTYFEKNQLFTISPDSNLDSFSNNGDHRDVYGVFHGLFTQSCISIFFDTCLEKELFSGKERMEVIGRLSDNMKRWSKIIEMFSQGGIFTETGEQFFDEFKAVYEKLYEKYEHLINAFDTSNQPYIFCFDKFYEANSKKLNEYATI